MSKIVYYDEIKPMTPEQWDYILAWEYPKPGDELIISSDDNFLIWVGVEPETPVYMGKVHGLPIYTT